MSVRRLVRREEMAVHHLETIGRRHASASISYDFAGIAAGSSCSISDMVILPGSKEGAASFVRFKAVVSDLDAGDV